MSGSALLGIVWAIGFILIVVLVMSARKRRRGGTMTAAPRERSGDDGAPASERVGGLRGGEAPRTKEDPFSQLEYQGWQRVAGRYQDTWAGLTAGFIEPLIDAAGVAAGQRVLDVASGPGFVAEAVHARGADVVGLDFSPEMITIARARCPEIEFRLGDAGALPFDAGSFDAVVMNFGLLHLPEAERALAEAARVLRPGGRYAFTVWAGPDQSPGARLVQDVLQAHANMTVPIPQGPDHLRHGRLDEWRGTLAHAGFDPASVAVTLTRADFDVPTDFFLFEAERHAGVRTAALLAAQTPEALAAIERQMTVSVRQFATADGFAIPYAAYVVSAIK